MKVRRALDLQFQAIGDKLQFHSPREGVLYDGSALRDSRLVDFLVSLSGWEPEDEVVGRLAGIVEISEPAARTEVKRLVKGGVLVSDEDPEQVDTFDATPLWSSHGWQEAFTYQVLSDSIKRVDYRSRDGAQADIAIMHQYLAEESQPAIHKAPMSNSTVTLPEPCKTLNVTLHEVLSRTGIPDQPSAPMSMQDLSTFLYFSFGQIGLKKTPALGDQVRKVSPSGGARHPTEAYLIILDAEHLAAGVYHYGVRDHVLEFITSDVDQDWVARNIAGKPEWMRISPTMAIVLTSRVERSMYRYRENYSYRPIHHDVGHILETASLAARALGHKFFRGFSVADREVSEKLGNPRLTEPTMAFMLLA
ncbi:SagB family peptide dehydrogenase [Streptomyces sp. NBC_01244]|uniref:SagB family peptide dehydrogenase n=1 Tax=Streptomyces sp. NBC_01244 TaxID=2903797 RepID=UPI002E165975|nr:SagB family peptide dehydrogenase [Streptomyces sp. NBC_01244]